MKLIGMLDSPYVRRAAISAKCLGITLEHQSVSVFRHFEQFQQINPVVKAPTLVLDDGEVLICLLYTSPSPRDGLLSRMPSSA